VFTRVYTVARSVADRANKLRYDFLGPVSSRAWLILVCEGMLIPDAHVAIEAYAVL
jgi:hypothetical protein